MDQTKFEIGDILCFSYIYTSCHPVFLLVEKIVNKSVYVSRLKTKITEDDGYGQNGYLVPDLTKQPYTEQVRCLIKHSKNGNVYIKYDGHIANFWDRTPQMFYSD